MKTGWSSRAQQRQSDVVTNKLNQLSKVGRMQPVPLTNLQATSDLKTRGAQVSFSVLSLEGIDSFVLLRNFSRDPGAAVAIHTWPAASLKSTPQTFPLALQYTDADSAIAGKVAYYWIRAVPVSTKTAGNVFLSGPQVFDASNFPTAKQIAGDFASYQAYTPTTKPLSAVTGVGVNQAQINVAAFLIQYPFDANSDGVPDLTSYNSGSIGPLNDNTQYVVYFDDPTYKGGAQTYLASTLSEAVTSSLHRQYLGTILTPAHGGGGTVGGGGGGGTCFSGNTLVQTRRGRIPIEQIKRGDRILTLRNWGTVGELLVHEYDGILHEMGSGELVTPEHRIYLRSSGGGNYWVPAREIFHVKVAFKGRVYNLALLTRATSDESHCYTLANGVVAHNLIKY